MAWLAAARFQEQQEVDYCRPKGERALATVTAVSLSKGVFSYHLEYDIGEKSGPAKLQVARDEGDQVFHERCGGEAVEATVQGVYRDEEG
eukprot:CAMPEP_0115135506 /NCGR_PEP_ID=MMETSP0227-20121206/55772_1 /TAXON_ID=89957 /ORGANISM="Polarella glacialis, Strain CCMP 1383" /LENGTH=89 /DNA_ID=CAMNT_0002542269 /DNA_START=110 /DNA_END=379 /DNA_ORIENTATION=+